MDTPLHRYAAAHDGVATRRAAASLGYDWPAFRRIVTDEGWQRFGRATWLAPGYEPTLRARVRAVQLRSNPLVASHGTAAALHGSDVNVNGLTFLSQGTSRYDVPDGTARRTTWRRGDVVDLGGGLLATSPVRTALDLLRGRVRDDAVVGVDGLLRARAVTLDEVAYALERSPRSKRAWRPFALLDDRSGSVAESRTRLLFHDARLRPRTQAVLLDDAQRRVRVDFWFPPSVVVEVEGFAFHATRDQHRGDVARFNALARLTGCTVLRFTHDDVVRRPRAVLAATRAALARQQERAA